MSGDFAHIARCLDLQEQDVVEAIGTRERTRALLKHLSSLSAPNTGVAKVLLVFARMATTACDWLDGDLAIDLLADGEGTRIETATELGGGLRERVFAPFPFNAPIAEFQRAIDRVPHMIAPLAIRAKGPRRIGLSATEAVRKTSVPPPPIEISTDSLYVRMSPPAVPKDSAAAEDSPQLPVVESRGQVPAATPVTAPSAAPAPPGPSAPSAPPATDIDSGWDD